jgi:hypothetical protein
MTLDQAVLRRFCTIIGVHSAPNHSARRFLAGVQ